MATSAVNNIVRSVAPDSLFADAANVISSAVSFNQGDILCFDTTNKVLKAIASDADGASCLGVAKVSVTAGVMNGPYTGLVDTGSGVAVGGSIPGPVFGVDIKVGLKSGDAFTPGCLVFYGIDAQSVSITGTNAIGVYQGAALTAGATSQGIIRILNRYSALA